MGKVKATGHQAQGHGAKDPFIFRYLRFKCSDLRKTIDFYTAIGLSVDWQVKQADRKLTVEETASLQQQQQTDDKKTKNGKQGAEPQSTVPGTTDGKKGTVGMGLPGIQLNKTDPKLAAADPKNPAGQPQPVEGASKEGEKNDELQNEYTFRTFLSLSFRGQNLDPTETNQVSLLFEYQHQTNEILRELVSKKGGDKDKLGLGLPKDKAVFGSTMLDESPAAAAPPKQLAAPQPSDPAKPSGQPSSTADTRPANEPPKLRNMEYLVIFVHFLPRLVKRLQLKGYDIVIPPTDTNEMKISVLRDPNEIEVRLIEMTETQLDENISKKQWFARLGYYAIPTTSAEETVRFFERHFAHNPPPPPNSRKGEAQRAKMAQVSKQIKKGLGEIPTHATTLLGFRLIDTEEFVLGLTKTQHYWLANDLRSNGAFALCFTERIKADSAAPPPFDRSNSKLLGIGFEVPNIEAIVKKWDWERPGDTAWEPGRVKIQGIGQFCKFKDRLNSLTLDLFYPKPIDPQEAKDKDAADAAKLKGILRRRNPAEVEFMDFEINHNHLKGTAKTKSEGALHAFRIPTTTHNDPGAEVGDNRDKAPRKTIKVKMHRTKKRSDHSEEDEGDDRHIAPEAATSGPRRLPKLDLSDKDPEYRAEMEKMIDIANNIKLPTFSGLYGPRMDAADRVKSTSMKW
ncbi:hypothetical protein HDV05_001551 [Chytridiales sp. JEL 0842]|nr:hypothetical protein HDV05_001551 [Chytridiales sp. JEL 0842]